MKRVLLVWAFGALAFPSGFALKIWLESLWLAWKMRQNGMPVTLVSVPFIDYNGQPLPEILLWALLALGGGAFSLTCYGVMCVLFRVFGHR